MIFNPQPKSIFKQLSEGCDKDCKFRQTGPAMTTAAYYPPVYNKEGQNINPDGNTTTEMYSCTECGKSWSVSTKMGVSNAILITG